MTNKLGAKPVGTMQRGELLATLAHHLNSGTFSLGILTGPQVRKIGARCEIIQVALGRGIKHSEAGYNNLRDVVAIALGLDQRGFLSIASIEAEILRLVKEHCSDRRKANPMSVDDILKAWAGMR